ncbi:MAG: vWA domain-containing protein, partial [Myxococcota bacterium]|nr:vWA domain-containing protein [Myxococcota bacterium]
MSTSALAYDFSEMCAPITEHDTTAGTPDVIIIVDVSGSMGNDGGGGKSKIQIARESISELAQAVGRTGPCTMSDRSGCDQIRLGLGRFSNSASIDVKPAENSYATVDTTVDGYNASGGTYMGAAAKLLFESNELKNAERQGVGVLITDGAPSSKGTVEQTIHYNCAMRDRMPGAVPNYAVGFGSGADPDTNSLVAAAGGTGECCAGSSCTYQPSQIVDPCDLPQRSSTQKNGDQMLNSNG